MVMIWAWWISAAWSQRCSFPGSSFSFFSTAAPIRSRISEAAALVKVITRSWSIFKGEGPSLIMEIMRSTNTAVFPLPAAADTSRFRFRLSMTCCCFSVHFICYSSPSPFLFTFMPQFSSISCHTSSGFMERSLLKP